MRRVLHHLVWLARGVQVFALIGRSGTGKSFRAKLIAEKYGIELIIDDGLLIRDQKIIAGKSAKKEKAYLSAIKTALFDDSAHCREVRNNLDGQRFKRVLVIGTSLKMVRKIIVRLGLPQPSKVIRIEAVATTEEIERAIRSRKMGGRHVIPVPTVEIARNYPSLVYESIRVFLKRKLSIARREQVFEKTVVQPAFGERGRISISEAALTQMVLHCADEFDSTIKIKKVVVKNDTRGYRLSIYLNVPFGVQISGNIHSLQDYIIESIERYTGIMIEKINIIIDKVS